MTINEWRVTKYDPKLRDSRGRFMGEEWTSFYDVGETFDGEVLTLERYVEVENSYVSAVLKFVRECDVSLLRVCELEIPDVHINNVVELDLGPFFDINNLIEGYEICDEVALDAVVRLMLREFLWCKLEFYNQFFIHFGSDYYMYIGANCTPCDAIKYAKNDGLYVEEISSPYNTEM